MLAIIYTSYSELAWIYVAEPLNNMKPRPLFARVHVQRWSIIGNTRTDRPHAVRDSLNVHGTYSASISYFVRYSWQGVTNRVYSLGVICALWRGWTRVFLPWCRWQGITSPVYSIVSTAWRYRACSQPCWNSLRRLQARCKNVNTARARSQVIATSSFGIVRLRALRTATAIGASRTWRDCDDRLCAQRHTTSDVRYAWRDVVSLALWTATGAVLH